MITSYTFARSADTVRVTVVSNLVGDVFYHWYVDGDWIGRTLVPTNTVRVPLGRAVEIICIDTLDGDFDQYLSAPMGYPPDRIICWCRSTDPQVVAYRVSQRIAGGDWFTVGLVSADRRRWRYSFRAANLEMALYCWRIVPIGVGGVEGPAIDIGPEFVVRLPAAPVISFAFDTQTKQVTFS